MAKRNVPDIGIDQPQSEKARFAGLSDQQVLKIFEQIASTASLMADMCRDNAERFGDHDSAVTFHALDTMLLGVGALADMPTGGNAVGGFADWMCGPRFREAATM